MRAFLVTLTVAASLLLVPVAHAGGSTPAAVTAAADKMRCDNRQPNMMAGPTNEGITCRVEGVGEFYVLRYDSARRGRRFWRDWFNGQNDYCLANRGRIFAIPAGPGDWYKCSAAKYAARKIDGHLLRG